MENKFNFIIISPHFPENFVTFAQRLNEVGFNTLGIADVPYDDLSHELQDSLTEYFKVEDMNDYDQVYRAVALFINTVVFTGLNPIMNIGLLWMRNCVPTLMCLVITKRTLNASRKNPV